MSSVERVVALVLLIAATTPIHAAQNAPVPPSGLTIVVVEGEDAVNVIPAVSNKPGEGCRPYNQGPSR